MSNRHSYIAFYPSNWMGGTARMPRLVESVFFRICLYTWDKAAPVPVHELAFMNSDLDPGQGEHIIDALVKSEKLVRNDDGAVYSPRALEEATKAYDLWCAKSRGGRKGAAATNSGGETPAGTTASEPDDSRRRTDQTRTEEIKEEGDSPPLVGEGDEKPDSKPARKTFDVQKIADAWNAMAKANKLTQVVKMTEERRKKTRARLEEYDEAQVLEAISLVPERPFLMGQNDRGWKADYDWLVRPNSIARTIEGGSYQSGGKQGGWRDA